MSGSPTQRLEDEFEFADWRTSSKIHKAEVRCLCPAKASVHEQCVANLGKPSGADIQTSRSYAKMEITGQPFVFIRQVHPGVPLPLW